MKTAKTKKTTAIFRKNWDLVLTCAFLATSAILLSVTHRNAARSTGDRDAFPQTGTRASEKTETLAGKSSSKFPSARF